ncbi:MULTISPECIES: helix-turn-helix domain-containing protein [Streptomyces]|uniref:Putative transcriptional regulator n=1 Tax=Streptomyces albus (strain ATCC 21838 / DSM 41398 / FERM P-419 / JCM 4703 / NBRC 107858) TaxID=1081613 RepID=A0A0B5EK14_STRA4|nr:helix-turn-helix transcriptional regulator [Streptomyces sp. SCSIO ZS0520]AJE82643.1 putative transcriptional regulator [Streptomyces albus]AOU76956.1 putative transcriptional regulator [Streptomyces albus]AYN32733.1 XRE family transcriptional regulator [Streptomyces albus]
MHTHAPNWDSPRARALIDAGDVGGLIRWARVELGWRQVDLGKATGYSASAVSRLETAHRSATDLDMLRNFAQALFIPASALAAVLRVTPSLSTRVAATAGRHIEAEEDPMRRRSLLQAAGLAVPLTVLNGLDESLALLPGPTSAPTVSNLMTQFRRARALFDVGDHNKLVLALPNLLATGHACAEDGEADDYVRLAACYDLATEVLSKIGRYSASRITADRSNIFSDLSGSPLAAAASARAFSIVLRHEDRGATAQRVTLHAADKVEATGLKTPAQAATFAQILCTVSYTAAQAGDRDRALEMIRAAERAAKLLADRHERPQTLSVTPASVALYKVGVLWSLGDAGAAVHAGKNLHPGQFPTAERRGRLHTDMARAWWQWGKPEETAAALLSAHREAPAEVRDRPGIRRIATQLAERHPRTSSVRQLTAALHARSA